MQPVLEYSLISNSNLLASHQQPLISSVPATELTRGPPYIQQSYLNLSQEIGA